MWTTLGQPTWDRFGLTVAKDHQQIWLDTPTATHTWPLSRDRGAATDLLVSERQLPIAEAIADEPIGDDR